MGCNPQRPEPGVVSFESTVRRRTGVPRRDAVIVPHANQGCVSNTALSLPRHTNRVFDLEANLVREGFGRLGNGSRSDQNTPVRVRDPL